MPIIALGCGSFFAYFLFISFWLSRWFFLAAFIWAMFYGFVLLSLFGDFKAQEANRAKAQLAEFVDSAG
ncbi:MAG: hypothetical protein KTR20_11435 [Cellvibrionaceae bacterium]|nr:hypothetical protein [Cellvibrionaceae bacterium]